MAPTTGFIFAIYELACAASGDKDRSVGRSIECYKRASVVSLMIVEAPARC